jgi:nucleoside-diphosphate-sugar epimerase
VSLKVLVTGAAGYVGSVLCERLLDEGYRVTGLDSLMYGDHRLFHLCADPKFDFIYGDARDASLLKQVLRSVDVIIPLAAIVGAPASDSKPDLARSVNLDAIALITRLRSASQLIVFPTTNSGYGTKSGDVFCTEETPLEPVSLYGQTKVDAERAVLSAANTITLRLATVFGTSPRMRLDLLVNHFVYAAMIDGFLVLFQKDFKRNFVHIRDVADCFVHCISNSQSMVGRPYNVGNDAANISKAELALKIKEFVPRFYVHFAEIGDDPDKRNYVVSNQRMREAGFEARRSLEEGIRELIVGCRLMRPLPFRNV